MERRSYPLSSPMHRKLAASVCLESADDGWYVTFLPPNRTHEQNRRLWAMLHDISEQLEWRDWQQRVIKMADHEWKDFLTATFRREQRMVMGEDGASFVLVGSRTSTMGIGEMSDFQTFIEAFATQRGVVFKEPVAQLEGARR
jgi:hypothetical protein